MLVQAVSATSLLNTAEAMHYKTFGDAKELLLNP